MEKVIKFKNMSEKKDINILITGASGFIGSNFIRELKKDNNFNIYALEHRQKIMYDGVTVLNCDIFDYKSCCKVLDGIDWVIHAAGTVGSAGSKAEAMMDGINLNLRLLMNMLQASWAMGVKRFLLFSSSTIYPPSNEYVSESVSLCEEPHPSYFGYGWMRRYMEKLGAYVHQNSQLDVVIVRPSAVYGPFDCFDPQRSQVIPALIMRALKKENPFVVWGTGNEIRDFVYVEDFCRGSLYALKYNIRTPVNIASGKDLSIKELVNIVTKYCNFNNADIIFDSTKPVNIPVRRLDISLAKEKLGYIPAVNIEEGIERTVEWFIKRDGYECL